MDRICTIIMKVTTTLGIIVAGYWMIIGAQNLNASALLQQQTSGINQVVGKLQALKNSEVDRILSGK